MEESSVEEINLIIKQQLKAGKTFDEIADDTGKSKWYIGNLKKQLILDGEISDEDIETARNRLKEKTFIADPKNQQILQYARLGLSQSDIAYEVKSTQTKISRILMQFKAYGVITQEEIDSARASYKKEIKYDDLRRDRIKEALEAGRLKSEFASEVGVTERGAKIIQDSLIEEGRITQGEIDKAVATKGKEAQKRNRVIELLRQGYLYKEVTEVVGYCPITVRKIKDKAISDGIFTEEEYQKQRVQRRLQMKQEPKKTTVDDEELTEKVLQMLKMGKDMFYMRRKTGKSKAEIQTAQKKLMKDGRITDEEIKEARKKAAEELERKVLIGLKKGETQREIVDSFGEGECTLQAVQTVIERLKAKGKITDEQIAIYKYEAEQGEKDLQEFVLLGIKQGLSRAKMIEKDETGYYTESRIKWAIKKMRQQGILTDKDIKQGLKVRRKNEQSKAKKKRKQFYRSVLDLLHNGYSIGEIAAELGYKEETIRAKVFDLKKEGKITPEAIDKAREIRVEKEQKETNTLFSNYKNNLRRAERLYTGDIEPTDEQRNALVNELISAADELVATGQVSKEQLKLMFDVLIDANDIQVSNVLGISRIYLKMNNYQGAIYTLNYSRSLFSAEEDLKQIDKTLGVISEHKRRLEAIAMFQQKYSFDVIQKRTQIGTAELLALQNSLKSDKKSKMKEDNQEKVL